MESPLPPPGVSSALAQDPLSPDLPCHIRAEGTPRLSHTVQLILSPLLHVKRVKQFRESPLLPGSRADCNLEDLELGRRRSPELVPPKPPMGSPLAVGMENCFPLPIYRGKAQPCHNHTGKGEESFLFPYGRVDQGLGDSGLARGNTLRCTPHVGSPPTAGMGDCFPPPTCRGGLSISQTVWASGGGGNPPNSHSRGD